MSTNIKSGGECLFFTKLVNASVDRKGILKLVFKNASKEYLTIKCATMDFEYEEEVRQITVRGPTRKVFKGARTQRGRMNFELTEPSTVSIRAPRKA